MMAGDSAIKHSPVNCRGSAYTQSRDYAIEESALKALLVDVKGGGGWESAEAISRE